MPLSIAMSIPNGPNGLGNHVDNDVKVKDELGAAAGATAAAKGAQILDKKRLQVRAVALGAVSA